MVQVLGLALLQHLLASARGRLQVVSDRTVVLAESARSGKVGLGDKLYALLCWASAPVCVDESQGWGTHQAGQGSGTHCHTCELGYGVGRLS